MADQNNQKILLIVEDEKPLARVMSLKLNSAGYADFDVIISKACYSLRL